MAEVVVSLDSILTLQEKTNNSLQTSGKTLYERMLDLLPFPSNEENSAHGDVKLSSDKKGKSPNFGDTIKADNKYSSNPSPNLKAFKFADLQRATKNFSQDFLLGDNGVMFLCWVDKFTSVPSTKGVGIAVAVKRCQGLQEYETVAGVLGSLAHPNIISLLGHSNDKPHEYLLVYEYMEKRNLDHFLFEDAPLSWGRRLIILIGVARALAYIHSSSYQVIHRNVKPSNIFLDQDFNAKLGDFGFAKFGSEIHKLDATTRVMGTIGYVDPSYVKTGHLTMKSDVYSFGVVLLVTLTGDGAWGSPNYQLNLAELAGPFLTSRSKLDKIMDPRLQKDYQLKESLRILMLARICQIAESLKVSNSTTRKRDVVDSMDSFHPGKIGS
ncbi:unnamed protein product [Lactuca virosa]|uniref:non-specific serine/threonine protein kinase n=1 Tax=Lactuca virosa TaxID=75947 RepID=A0AAU9PHL2_9ASTR|nr:unnamed protein product [Lactuca virosa]